MQIYESKGKIWLNASADMEGMDKLFIYSVLDETCLTEKGFEMVTTFLADCNEKGAN